jgi:Omp85 superfamily domain
MRALWIISAWIVVAALPLPSAAQSPTPSTRADALRQEREKKQQELRPNRRDAVQRAFDFAEERSWFVVTRDGLYPKLGSLTTGSGFALGVGFRDRDLFARHGALELWTAGSFQKYWAMEVRTTFPDLARGRVMAEGVASLREYPSEEFFGLGPDSKRSDETTFFLRTPQVTGRAGVRVVPPLLVGGGVSYLKPRTADGKSESVPGISDLFNSVTAPGLGTEADFVQPFAFVEVDYRQPRNARRGGWYRFDFSQFNDRNDGAWSFRRTVIDLQQFIGFLADRRVLALRGRWQSATAPDDSQGVPFYLMPWLGGNDTLRGFRSYRFRGPHALLLQAEYRFELWSGLDAALFYDAGQVALRRSDVKLGDLESDYGFGFRFNTNNGVVMRFDAAFGSRDGKHLHIVFGGVF